MRERKAEKGLPSHRGVTTQRSATSKKELKPNGREADGKILLEIHRQHVGLYRRVAQKLNVDASYVSRVASGQRKSDPIERALVQELANLYQNA